MFRVDDLRLDRRWVEFGHHAAEQSGLRSMLPYRLHFKDQPHYMAGLNLYSTYVHAFTEVS